MSGKNKTRFGLISKGIVLVLALFISIPMVMGQEETETQKNKIVKQQKKDGYQNMGHVLRVGEEEIVVDDHLINLAKNVAYHAPGRGGLISKNIKEGSYIGFNLNDKKEITDIWILKN